MAPRTRTQHLIRTIAAALSAALLTAILLPLVTRAGQQTIALAPGDTLSITCETSLSGTVQGKQASVQCAAPSTPTPTAAPGGPTITEIRGVSDGATLSGKIAIEALVSGSSIDRVVFDLAGPTAARHTERNKPYFFMGDVNGTPNGWDTATAPNGSYTLTITAITTSGLSGRKQVKFSIANGAQATATPLPPTATPTSVAPSPTATAGTAPVAGQQCPDWVHDRYMTTGPDGKQYRTWHPPTDPEFGCWFGHEHGSDPRQYVGFASSGMPAFGYSAAQAGMDEPHVGFKVYVANNDLNGRAWMITLHQGTGGPRRALVQFHTLDWHISTTAGQPLVDIHHMADFGYATPNCQRDQAIPGSATGRPFSPHDQARRFVPTTDCVAQTVYEEWNAVVNIAGLFWANPNFDIDNAATVINLANLSELRYMCEFKNPNEDCTTPSTRWGGTKRGVIHPGQLVNNTTGSAEVWTNAFGQAVAAGSPGAIRQTISAGGWDTRNCCGNQVVFRVQRSSGGLYIADPAEDSNPFGDSYTKWPD